MNVTNLSPEERIKLFKKWLEDNNNFRGIMDFDDPNFSYLTFGNDVDITKEQLEDPNFILLEWDEKLPDWMRELAPKIGCKCTTAGEEGIFLGFTASYEDFYYRIQKDDGNMVLETCVSCIKFDNEEEETK